MAQIVKWWMYLVKISNVMTMVVFVAQNSLALSGQMELQILSEQLGFLITDNEKSPFLDDIYEVPQQEASLKLSSGFHQQESGAVEETKRCCQSPISTTSASSSTGSANSANNRSRLRWTLELHEILLTLLNSSTDMTKQHQKEC